MVVARRQWLFRSIASRSEPFCKGSIRPVVLVDIPAATTKQWLSLGDNGCRQQGSDIWVRDGGLLTLEQLISPSE